MRFFLIGYIDLVQFPATDSDIILYISDEFPLISDCSTLVAKYREVASTFSIIVSITEVFENDFNRLIDDKGWALDKNGKKIKKNEI